MAYKIRTYNRGNKLAFCVGNIEYLREAFVSDEDLARRVKESTGTKYTVKQIQKIISLFWEEVINDVILHGNEFVLNQKKRYKKASEREYNFAIRPLSGKVEKKYKGVYRASYFYGGVHYGAVITYPKSSKVTTAKLVLLKKRHYLLMRSRLQGGQRYAESYKHKILSRL